MIGAILEFDQAALTKQRQTAKRIFERLRNGHGVACGYAVLNDYVRIGRETSLPKSDACFVKAYPCETAAVAWPGHDATDLLRGALMALP